MKTVFSAVIAVSAFVATSAFAHVGVPLKSDQQCNTWQNGKYVSQPSTTRNSNGSTRR